MISSFKKIIAEMKISLEYHDELNPKLWDGEKLKPEVRTALLKFIEAWRQYANIPKDLIQDIIMIGGNTNYNYTSKSDIDVHLIVDRNKLGKDRKLIDDYLQDKKVLWTMTHNVTVFGYPLEPYAQDPVSSWPKGQGVYSLKNNEWVQKPEKGEYDFKNDKMLKQKVQHFMHVIDHMIKNKMSIDQFENLKNKLKNMRGAAIQKGGEYSMENLVFKELRNRGYLDKMSKYEKSLQDKSLSL
jgi:hypothetical protein